MLSDKEVGRIKNEKERAWLEQQERARPENMAKVEAEAQLEKESQARASQQFNRTITICIIFMVGGLGVLLFLLFFVL